MRVTQFAALGAALSLTAMTAQAGTLEDVQARGELNCVVTVGVAGFAAPDENGKWTGFDVDFCRAVAAAVLGDGEKVKFVPTTGKTRFTVLNSGEGDILFRNTTETMSRDADLKLTFLPVNYYDGQGFLIRKELGITSAKDLGGASICIQTGTTTELNLADYFRVNGIDYEPVAIETNEEGITNYSANRCDVYTTDASGLASTRAALDDPSAHMILPEIISKEPLGGAVRHGDDQWADIGKWVVNALIIAEELGVTSANVAEHAAAAGNNPSINRLLGTEGDMGAMIGLDKEWAVRAISAGGNYAESFDRNIGPDTPIGLSRGLNALWTNGGILYAAPIR
ncbi:MAG: transporter substrate-binding domain-containing protein [Gammaproteobacteria bacterium]|nr:transporter substrate-binding domain-containing protein [Gammaproteobacteria bacterium]